MNGEHPAPLSVCLVVVNYMTPELSDNLVARLLNESPVAPSHAILVDNSPEHTSSLHYSFGVESHPNASVLSNESNRGFAGAINDAVRAYPTADYYWVLNPDTEPAPDALAALMDAARSGSDIIGSLILDPSGKVQSNGGRASVLFGIVAHQRSLRGGNGSESPRSRRVAWIHGASMLISRPTLTMLNGFDERYFLYYEETDLCYRARQFNLQIAVAEDSRVIHSSGGSISAASMSVARDMYLSRNYVLFARRHVPLWRLVVPVWMVGVAAVRLARGQLGRTRAHLSASVEGLRGGTGPMSW